MTESSDTVKLTCTISATHMDWLHAEAAKLSDKAGVAVPTSAVVRAAFRYAERMRSAGAIDDWDALAR